MDEKEHKQPTTPNTNVTTSDTADKITPQKSQDDTDQLAGTKRLAPEGSPDATDENGQPQKKARTNETNMHNPIALDWSITTPYILKFYYAN